MNEVVVLNDTTLNIIIDRLKSVLNKPFELNGCKYTPGRIIIHHMINMTIFKNESRPMILFSFGGSSAIYWCEHDIFEFLKDGSIKITALNAVSFQAGEMRHIKKNYIIKRTKLTKKQYAQLIHTKKMNIKFNKQYWESVKQDLEDDLRRDMMDWSDDNDRW